MMVGNEEYSNDFLFKIVALANFVGGDEGSVYLGTNITKNPLWKPARDGDVILPKPKNVAPKYFSSSAWMNDALGLELGFEIQGNEHTQSNHWNDVYLLTGREWEVSFMLAFGYTRRSLKVFDREGVPEILHIDNRDALEADLTLLAFTGAAEALKVIDHPSPRGNGHQFRTVRGLTPNVEGLEGS